jgi:simple sugar transport system permease protein
MLLPVWALLITLAFSAALIALAGANVAEAFWAMFQGALGTRFGLLETCVASVPLVFCGLAVAFAFRAKFWNIGAEGQFLSGALAATAVALALPGLPSPLGIPLVFAVGFLAGGAVALICALLKTKLKVDDVVSTLLMNYLILNAMGALLYGPLQLKGSSWPVSTNLAPAYTLPVLLPRSRFHLGVILALAAVGIMYVVQNHSVFGYRSLAVGTNLRAARFGGIKADRVIILTALVSGGLAGLGGVSELLGIQHHLLMDISPGYGTTGVVVAMLGQLSPLGVLGASFFFSAISNGANTMSRALHVPVYISQVIQGLSLIVMLVLLLFKNYRVCLRRDK